MKFMTCTTCRRVVQENNIGICLGCQQGFSKTDCDDVLITKKEVQRLKKKIPPPPLSTVLADVESQKIDVPEAK